MDIHSSAGLAGLIQGDFKNKKSTPINSKGKTNSLFAKNLMDSSASEEVSDETTSKEIEGVIDEVFMLGEKLKKDYALENLANYRKAIKRLFNYILDEAYEHKSVMGVINRKTMMQKRYAMVQIVDEKLDKLARAVVSDQKNLFDILGKVNEINGLIINLWR